MNRPGFLYKWLLPVALFFSIIFSSNAFAEGINLRGEFNYTNTDSKTTSKFTGLTADSVFSQYKQIYSLDFTKIVYPYLTLGGGAFYELDNGKSTSESTEIKTKDTLLRPYVELNLDNPIYKAGVVFRKSQIENKTTGIPDTEYMRDELNTILGWRPDGLPHVDFRYSYTHTYNNPETANAIDRLLELDSKYNIGKDIDLSYFYRRTEKQDNIDDSETLEQDHNAKINYSHNFFKGRLLLNTGYQIRYNTFEVPNSAIVDSPLLRSAGLSSFDNTPEDGPLLDPNPSLINGNLTASAGLNLGLNGDETTLVNMAIDFGFDVDVDKIYIWVDRRLSPSVANSFSWSIYTSPDNTDTSTWTLQTTVFPAIFGTFDNRFEISFPSINTRFIKVVTRPISPVVPGAAVFPDIFVTEMEAFTTALEGVTSKRIDHNYNFNLMSKLTDKTVIGYNLFYLSRKEEPISENDTELTNGMYARHIFNRVFSSSASFSHTDRKENEKESNDNNYSVSLKAAYWDSLRQILTYSGTETKEEDGPSSKRSIFLRTNAELYRGWSAFLDTGYSWDEPLESTPTTSTIVRAVTNLLPNDKITINMNYAVTNTKENGGENRNTSKKEYGLQAFLTPFRALTFNFRFNVIDQNDSKSTLYDYSANWSPFPDGDLQLFFSYTETLRPEYGQKERSMGPGLKWSLNRHFFLDMSYNISNSENTFQTIDSNTFNANLRLNF